MKRIFLTLCVAFVALCALAVPRNYLTSRYSEDQIRQWLITEQKWVPFPSYYDRSAWDNMLSKNKAMLIKRGESKLNYNWEYIPATAYLEYNRSGNRTIMEDPDSRNKNALAALFLAELAEGQGRFIDKIIDGVFYECERTSWVLSAHLPRQLDSNNQNATGSSLPNGASQIIDLGSGEMGGMLSWIYYFLHAEFDRVDPAISSYLHRSIESKILTPYMQIDHWWMGLQDQFTNNWNVWCNFNVLQCFLLLENNQDRLVKMVMRSMLSVDKFLNYVKADGACEEGPSYWGHAAGKLFDYLDLLYIATNGHVNLFEESMIQRMGEYIAHTQIGGNNWVVNFADATAQFTDNISGLVYRFGKRTHSSLMIGYAQQLVQKHPNVVVQGTDVFRAMTSLLNYDSLMNEPIVTSKYKNIWYDETEFMYVRKGKWFLGAKCGHNDESHNHNDVGSFILYVDNAPLLIDAGTGTYTRQTFSSERYTLWMMQSGWHSLPVVNGVEQHNGRQFHGQVLRANESKGYLKMDIAQAYPDSASLKSWIRTYQLTEKGLHISDSWQLGQVYQPNEVHFLFANKKDVERLHYDKKRFHAEIDEQLLSDPRLGNIWGKAIYRLRLVDQQPATKGTYSFSIK